MLRVAASSLDGDISSHTGPLVRSCGARDDQAVISTTIPLAFKLAYTAFVLLWMVAAYGYHPRVGLTGAIVLAAVVLPLSRQLGDPDTSINWTYGLGRPNRRLSGAAYVGLLYLGLVVFVFLPTDLLLRTAGF